MNVIILKDGQEVSRSTLGDTYLQGRRASMVESSLPKLGNVTLIDSMAHEIVDRRIDEDSQTVYLTVRKVEWAILDPFYFNRPVEDIVNIIHRLLGAGVPLLVQAQYGWEDVRGMSHKEMLEVCEDLQRRGFGSISIATHVSWYFPRHMIDTGGEDLTSSPESLSAIKKIRRQAEDRLRKGRGPDILAAAAAIL